MTPATGKLPGTAAGNHDVSTEVFRGTLFADDFLVDAVAETDEWREIDGEVLDSFGEAVAGIFQRFPVAGTPNESQTEDELIWPILAELGWTANLRQQNMSMRGRDDVPDGLMFADDAAKGRADEFGEEWRRYELGLALVESKRWLRPLDRRSGQRGEETAPSTQMLRYLRRADDLTEGRLRWGILTNGARWRLYHSGARSVSEQFFDLDLAAILGLKGQDGQQAVFGEEDRRHWLAVFLLMFRRDAFMAVGPASRTFHERAIEHGKLYEERVAEDISGRVFGDVFPALVNAIAGAAPETDLAEVRDSALTLLYRLLFILYAEDRGLLPVRETAYEDYGLREKVRRDVGRRKDRDHVFSDTQSRYWDAMSNLFVAIDGGDSSIGLPPYDGGLFDRDRYPVLDDIRIPDTVMAAVIDSLSFEGAATGRRYINYRNLSVQQLGSIYERLLEYEVIRQNGEIVVRPNVFARKGSGSYYTPDDLVQLILAEAVGPMVDVRTAAFRNKIKELSERTLSDVRRNAVLKGSDPAEKLLELKICDPAMGSGHFLVSLADFLTDQVIAAMADAELEVPEEWGEYTSPLNARIDEIRNTILVNAGKNGWAIDEEQLNDRHIVRRMILKRCIYGVDKNPMAVELAKVALWLHTFTAGAPLSFIDHHLRCGDSLFGSWVGTGVEKARSYGGPLLLHEPIAEALRAAEGMQLLDRLPDVEIAEAHRSASVFEEIRHRIRPLDSLLSLVHALDWFRITDKAGKAALNSFFGGEFGDPVDIVLGKLEPRRPEARAEGERLKDLSTAEEKFDRFVEILDRARALIGEERFFNWQAAFPGVWSDWGEERLSGGFDAVIGNPPWDRMKLEQVAWFAERRSDIARAERKSDRQQLIEALKSDGDPLAADFARASERVEAGVRVARRGGDYPLLSGGDINLYSLFVERAMTLVKRDGLVGLLVPSGIASDKTAARFFRGLATAGRLRALFDFENRRTRYGAPPFFPDVDSRFKFCALVAGRIPSGAPARCAFFLQDVSELDDPERFFRLTAADFARVNPNTGTAPIFRSRRDAELTIAVYSRLPVLASRSAGEEIRAWPVKYTRMLDMAMDSGLFRTREELEEREGAYRVEGNGWRSADGDWLPLYEGKMVQAFDHRAADTTRNEENLFRPGQQEAIPPLEKRLFDRLPTPRYFVMEDEGRWSWPDDWCIAFKDVTAATNMRTMIAALIPRAGAGHTLPLLPLDDEMEDRASTASLIVANLNAVPFDFVARQKVPATHLTWYVMEQLPVIPLERYDAVRYGAKTAGEIVREAVLELTYTADDMAPFARDMGHVDEKGEVRQPFVWNEERRLFLRARLDAVFFNLYGVTDRDDVRHIYSTFPIVERQERNAYGGVYRSCELCLGIMNALEAGDPDATVAV